MASQMSNLKVSKNRYLHALQKEISDSETLLELEESKIDANDIINKINVSIEKLQSYSTKLDKLVDALVD